MRDLALLRLDLRSPLLYRALGPFPGSLLDAPIGGAGEDGEELWAFEEGDLLRMDPDEGPRLLGAVPAPRFRGIPGNLGSPGSRGPDLELAPGEYRFTQFEPADPAELAAGVEWFAREAWWVGEILAGPLYLRRIAEDGRRSVQILRRLA